MYTNIHSRQHEIYVKILWNSSFMCNVSIDIITINEVEKISVMVIHIIKATYVSIKRIYVYVCIHLKSKSWIPCNLKLLSYIININFIRIKKFENFKLVWN